jgi:hypothetical protein
MTLKEIKTWGDKSGDWSNGTLRIYVGGEHVGYAVPVRNEVDLYSFRSMKSMLDVMDLPIKKYSLQELTDTIALNLKESLSKFFKQEKSQLSKKAQQYLAEVVYSLEIPDGDGFRSPTKAEALSHCLEELAEFEKATDDQITNWIQANYPKHKRA